LIRRYLMRIARAQAYVVDLEPLSKRTDATLSFEKQETVFVDIETEDGAVGTGYAYTIGTGGRAVMELLRADLLHLLIGEEPTEVEALWQKLYWAAHSTAVGAITSLALAAIDIAVWDLRGKCLGEPVWRLAGGARHGVPIYDTEHGWLHLASDDLIAGAQESLANGMGGVKIKVGKPTGEEDAERLAAVRQAIGARTDLMVDANQAFTAAEARRRARLFEDLNLLWFEEPLLADDISGHRRLAASTTIPVAVGESIYSVGTFREYLAADAASVLQPDVARVGGITPWLKVAHTAEAFNVKVAPHFLMELHVSLACAVPNAIYVEYIPQLAPLCLSRFEILDGLAIPPSAPGIGIEWDRERISEVAVGRTEEHE
jgi:L-alanine-DL-glutamate epimerase-like enolase superfamily enzyme